MAELATADGTVEVEIVNEQSHHGRYVQVRAVDPDLSIRDESGNPPWLPAREVSVDD